MINPSNIKKIRRIENREILKSYKKARGLKFYQKADHVEIMISHICEKREEIISNLIDFNKLNLESFSLPIPFGILKSDYFLVDIIGVFEKHGWTNINKYDFYAGCTRSVSSLCKVTSTVVKIRPIQKLPSYLFYNYSVYYSFTEIILLKNHIDIIKFPIPKEIAMHIFNFMILTYLQDY